MTLDQTDIENIVQALFERFKPLLADRGKQTEDVIFDVKGLAEYLHVETSWVYKSVSLKEIPHFKVGKYTRFKKSRIDKWMDGQEVRPIPALKLVANGR